VKREVINNIAVKNIGLININYKEDVQLKLIRSIADEIMYFDNDDLFDTLEYIRDCDTVHILSFSFIHDEPIYALNYRSALNEKGVTIISLMEKEVINESLNAQIFHLSITAYQASKFIMANRVNNKDG
jgi:hypothetical protein